MPAARAPSFDDLIPPRPAQAPSFDDPIPPRSARAPSFDDPIPPRPAQAPSFDDPIPPRSARAPSFDDPIPPRPARAPSCDSSIATHSGGAPTGRQNSSCSSPRSQIYMPLISTSRSTARVPPLRTVNVATLQQLPKDANNLCSFCRQGGYVRSCVLCKAFASCISKGDLIGCLPEGFLDGDQFICPGCYKSTGLAPRYSIPSRATAPSHSGTNTSPLIVYMVYLDEGPHSRAPATTIDGQVRGYFHGKEDQLLILVHPFKDLSEKNEKFSLTKNVGLITAFIHLAPICRFVLLLQTHADPTSGLLHFSTEKCTGINVILEYILQTLRHHQFSNSILLLSSCGYFARRHLSSLRDAVAALGFDSSFSFTGYALDPLLVTVALYYHIFDFHIIGNETSRKALERSVCVSLLTNTSVVLMHAGNALLLCGAAIRHRPNGRYISCDTCHQPAGYRQMLKGGHTAIFKCHEIEHKGKSRYQAVPLLQSDESTTVVGGLKDRCRYIIRSIPFNVDVQFWNGI